MSVFTSAQAFQQTRHARRLYVGGIPPGHTDEEELKSFLNRVIATGLGAPNDGSYVLSIYLNTKKCFAFIELQSIELATACLALDGLLFKRSALKVLRANEYRPDLVPPTAVGSPLVLDLSSFPCAPSPSAVASNSNPSSRPVSSELRPVSAKSDAAASA
eukprot:gene44801-54792_t